jgi:hypothetical protein
MDQLIKKYFDHYVALTKELKGDKEAKKAAGKKSYYQNVSPEIRILYKDKSLEQQLDGFNLPR